MNCNLCGIAIPVCGVCNTNLCTAPVCVKHAPIIGKILRGHNIVIEYDKK